MKWQSPNPPGVAEGAEQVGQHGARMPRTKLASRKPVLVTVDNTSFPPDRQGAFSQHSCRHLLWARPRCGCWTNSEQSTTDRQTPTCCPLVMPSLSGHLENMGKNKLENKDIYYSHTQRCFQFRQQ